MTQKVNPVTLLASPLGEEGHEVAKGCTRVRMIMTLDVDVTAERRHYNTHRPLKGKRGTWREKQASHILHVPFRCFPLWCLTAPPFPRKRGHYKAPLCCEPLMKGLLCRALLSHRSARRRWWRQPPKGDAFPTPAGRLYGFRRQRRHKKWR